SPAGSKKSLELTRFSTISFRLPSLRNHSVPDTNFLAESQFTRADGVFSRHVSSSVFYCSDSGSKKCIEFSIQIFLAESQFTRTDECFFHCPSVRVFFAVAIAEAKNVSRTG